MDRGHNKQVVKKIQTIIISGNHLASHAHMC